MWPALRITLETLFHRDLWHFAPFLALAAIILALLGGARRVSLYAGAFLAAGVAVVTWILWVNHGIALIHDDWAIRRFVGTPVLVLAVLTPLLLQRAWSEPAGRASGRRARRTSSSGRRERPGWSCSWVLLSHPGSMLLGYSGSGLPGGAPRFPGDAGCASAPVAGDPVRVVVGYADTYPEAECARAVAPGPRGSVRRGSPRTVVAASGCPSTTSPRSPLLSAARRALDPTSRPTRA